MANNLLGNGTPQDLMFLSSLVNATDLDALRIDQNNFRGGLPQIVGNFSQTLRILHVGYNRLTGTIPDRIQNLIGLQRFGASDNSFSGAIPSSLGKLRNLEMLLLGFNGFNGMIPPSIGNLTRLSVLDLSRTNLEGEIPSALVNLQTLTTLDMSNNKLSGRIPGGLMTISSLSDFLDLCGNKLTGQIPDEVGNLRNLGSLGLYGNMLSGRIPTSLGSCVRMELLYIQDNLLQGSIPSSLSGLRGLREFNVSGNNLSGQVPEFLQSFTSLQLLNLSYNNFEGEVPDGGGVFRNASGVAVTGNSNLCGGIPELLLPTCTFQRARKKGLSRRWKIVIISTASGLLASAFVISCLLVFLARKRRKQRQQQQRQPQEMHDPVNDLQMKVSYQSLSKATDGFSSANLIGAGSYGSVYKGSLHSSGGALIAVKVFNLSRQGASKSFLTECEALRSIRHRNLVRILTACSGIDYGRNDFKALVYDFMENGNLDKWIHSTYNEERDGDGRHAEEVRCLNLMQRLNVAIDVASALEYLHHQCETPIVHCDIKPSNVLLDTDMVAHLVDFGLAKLLQQVSLGSSVSSIGVRGTVGYAPPEYGMGSAVSTQGDVYSYGILLLEMFTGKRPTHEMFKEGFNLHDFVGRAVPENIAAIVDPLLFSKVPDDDGEYSRKHKEALASILQVGVACCSDSPRHRMNIKDVAAKLLSAKKLVESKQDELKDC